MKFRAKIAAAMAVAFAFATQTVHAQNVGVKANALSFAHTALGMGAERSLGYHWSAELYGVISPWKRTEDSSSDLPASRWRKTCGCSTFCGIAAT